MGTALVRDVLRRSAVLLQDLDLDTPVFIRWLQADCVDFLNDAQRAIAKYVPSACSRLDAIKLRPGTFQSIELIAAADCKPGDGSTPSAPIVGTSVLRLVCNMGADGLTTGRAIGPAVIARLLDAQNPYWHQLTGLDVRGFAYDPATPTVFFATPGVPSTGSTWVRIAYTAQPLAIPAPVGGISYAGAGSGSGITETIKVGDQYVDDLVAYVVARANMVDSEWSDANKAATFASMFADSLNAQVTARTGHNPNLKRLPFAPTPMGVAG